MEKYCLITHIADADGAVPILLSKFVPASFDVFSCEANEEEVDSTLKNVLEKEEDYKIIFIVDVNISEEMANFINNQETIKKKIEIYDHHASKEYLNQFSFEHVIVEQNGKLECGSTLIFKRLKEIYPLPIFEKEILLHFIELIRQTDTYSFTDDLKEEASNLGSLYAIYGRENFIEHYYDFLLNQNVFSFTKVEMALLKIEKERKEKYIEEKLKHVKKAMIHNIPVGIVFAEDYRSDLGHKMAETMPDIDIAIIINVDRSVSYRAEKDLVDASILAVMHGGGGHKHACGSPLPKDLDKKISELIFDDIKW